mgnify:CR=1 FL=1
MNVKHRREAYLKEHRNIHPELTKKERQEEKSQVNEPTNVETTKKKK